MINDDLEIFDEIVKYEKIYDNLISENDVNHLTSYAKSHIISIKKLIVSYEFTKLVLKRIFNE